MIDKEKAYTLLNRHISFCEISSYGSESDPENEFWIPFSEEISKDIDSAIDFFQELTPNEFIYALEALEEIIERTHSQRLLNEIKRIGTEKEVDQNTLEVEVKYASYHLSQNS